MTGSRRIATRVTSIMLATSVALLPLQGAGAVATADPQQRFDALLNMDCGTHGGNVDDAPQVVADTSSTVADSNTGSASPTTSVAATSAPTTTSSSATTVMPTATATDATVSTSSTASASPQPSDMPTPIPLQGILRGPGTLIPPPDATTPALTPPPVPTPTVEPTVSAGPVYLIRTSPTPSGAPSGATPGPTTSAQPAPIPTLGPNQIAILADQVNSGTSLDQPADADGNVHVYYRDGVMIGDHAHYDGKRYVTVTGNTYLQNNAQDTRLYADAIIFDITTDHAVLQHGKGATSRGVQQGLLHYRADALEASSTGHVHGTHATFSTCENPRGGYHVAAKSIDVTPGKKFIARDAVVFLGGLAIFFIPVLSIPLNRSENQRRPVVFAPEMGYDDADGFYARARIGYGTTATYYGYYRVEEYTRRGLGLGYVSFLGSRNGRRQVHIDTYVFNNKGGGQNDNLSIQDNETFSPHLQGQFGSTYTSEYGPYVSLPPSYSFNGTVNHTTPRSTQGYSFSRTSVGSQQSTINTAFQDSYQLSPASSEALSLNLATNANSYAGYSTPTSSLHINSQTHSSTRGADYTLTVDKTDATDPSGYDKLPEFVYHPHASRGTIPVDTQLTVGTYSEPSDDRVAQRSEGDFTVGPALFTVLHDSTLSATLGGSQYYYSTGDLKAQTRQTLNLTTPVTRHISNVIQYQEQNLAGPQSLPYQYLDVLGGVEHNAQEALTFANGGIYSLTLTTGTAFNSQAEPISYQLISHPSSRSYVSVGGSYNPGAGNGFSLTNVQVATPFGRDQDLEFTTNVDWKSSGRLENKNIYFRKIIGNCYDIRLSYNQDLKAVNVSFDLLAFPSQGVNFGFSNQQQAIFPQNFVVQ